MSHITSTLQAAIGAERHRLFDTRDLDEVRDVCSRVFSPHRLQVIDHRGGLHARMSSVALGRMSLSRLGWGAAMAVDPGALDGYHLLVLPSAGRARFQVGAQWVDLSTQVAAIVSAGERFRFETTADYEQTVVRISGEAMAQAWWALSGREGPARFRFDAALPLDRPAWQALAPMLEWLARCAQAQDSGRMALGQALLPRSEELLATTLLMHQPHDLAPSLWPAPPPARHAALRRAEAFMQERLDQPLTAGDVARQGGLSLRRLQALFQDEHGLGPMQWLRRQRLHAARAALKCGAGQRAAVSEVAMRFQFSNLGDFSRLYRECFGESPRETLMRGPH